MSKDKEMNLSLYNMTDEMYALEKMLEMDQGEVTEDHELLETEVKNLIQNKTDSCVGWMTKQKDLMTIAKERIKAMQAFVSVRQNAIARFEEYVLICMDKLDTPLLKGQLCEIKKRKPSQILDVYNEDKVPAEFITSEVLVKINKTDLKKAIKDGQIKEECGAKLIDGKQSLMFKLASVK